MRDLINIVEKYSEPNSYALRHLRVHGQEFDFYRYWHEVAMWADEHDIEFTDDDGDVIAPDDLPDYDPSLFEQLPADQQEEAGQWVMDYLTNHAPGDLPSSHFFDAEGKLIPRGSWLVHFTDHAYSIIANGFTHGTQEVDRLGLTTYSSEDSKKYGGYNFAFEALSRHASWAAAQRKYGKEAIMFQSSGVKAWHNSDEEDQIIFWGPEVDKRSLIRLYREYDEWSVYNHRNDRKLYSGRFEDVVKWVIANSRQYARVLYR